MTTSIAQGKFSGIVFRGLSHSARSYEPSKKCVIRDLLKLPEAITRNRPSEKKRSSYSRFKDQIIA